MQRAALYLRASSDHQKYSTANQEEALRRYADCKDLRVVATYEDDGRSGLDLDGRPALRQLLQDVLDSDGAFDVVLVLDVSRWGRFQDVDESAYYEFMCKRAGVQVIYCAEPYIDVDSPMAAVFKSMKRAMAAEYSRELSGKVLAGQRRLVREGFSQGGLPSIGLRRLLVSADGEAKGLLAKGQYKSIATDRVVFVPGPPEEIALVTRIFRLCAEQRLGPVQIARLLNREAVTTPRGAPWRASHVKYLLRNEKYAGTNISGRTTGPLKARRKPTAPETWVRKELAFTPVVSPQLFEAAQAALSSRRRGPTDEAMLAQLAGLYAHAGRLTEALVDSQPDMPSANSYRWRFGSLVQAFALVGYRHQRTYTPGVPRLGRTRAPKFERDELVGLLRACLERHGQLSRTIIEANPMMPSLHTFLSAFGSIGKAYAAIGYERPRRHS